MSSQVLLKTSPAVLNAIENGVTAYAQMKRSYPCTLLLSDGRAVRLSVYGQDVGPKLECFSLTMEFVDTPANPLVPFNAPTGSAVSVLLREEYTEPFSGDPTGLVGKNPITRTSARPGCVPKHALDSCLVAYGVLVEGATCALAIVADWAPFHIELLADADTIAELVAISELVPIAEYLRRFG